MYALPAGQFTPHVILSGAPEGCEAERSRAGEYGVFPRADNGSNIHNIPFGRRGAMRRGARPYKI